MMIRRIFAFLMMTAIVAALPFSASALTPDGKKKILLIAGTPSHGPGDHEFNAGSLLLQKCLKDTPGIEVVVNLNGWPKDTAIFDGVDAVVVYMDGGGGHPAIRPENLELLRGLIAKGVGFGAMHYGVEVPADKGGAEWMEWIGGYYETLWSCNPMWSPDYTELPKHPVTNGVKPFTVRDEWYFNMRFRPDLKDVVALLSAKPSDEVRDGPYVAPRGPYPHIQANKGQPEHMMWCVERPDGGRGFGFTGGHFHKNWGHDDFRKIVLNAILWTAKVEVPEGGVASTVTEEDLAANLDPKGKK